eukprot:COSAG02_NODE_4381_length_5425_cov_58.839655_2_plen_912_part_01
MDGSAEMRGATVVATADLASTGWSDSVGMDRTEQQGKEEQYFGCEYDCGFTGNYETVAEHERNECPRRPDAAVASSIVNTSPLPSISLTPDEGVLEREKNSAGMIQQPDGAQGGSPVRVGAMATCDLCEHLAEENAAANAETAQRIASGTLSVKMVVERRGAGRSAWSEGYITSVKPLKVTCTLASPTGEGFEWEAVRPVSAARKEKLDQVEAQKGVRERVAAENAAAKAEVVKLIASGELKVGALVERRDGANAWREGYITKLEPLKVTCSKSRSAEGLTWDGVRPVDSAPQVVERLMEAGTIQAAVNPMQELLQTDPERAAVSTSQSTPTRGATALAGPNRTPLSSNRSNCAAPVAVRHAVRVLDEDLYALMDTIGSTSEAQQVATVYGKLAQHSSGSISQLQKAVRASGSVNVIISSKFFGQGTAGEILKQAKKKVRELHPQTAVSPRAAEPAPLPLKSTAKTEVQIEPEPEPEPEPELEPKLRPKVELVGGPQSFLSTSNSLTVASPVRRDLEELRAFCARAFGLDEESGSLRAHAKPTARRLSLEDPMEHTPDSTQNQGGEDMRVMRLKESPGLVSSPRSPHLEQLCSVLQIRIPGPVAVAEHPQLLSEPGELARAIQAEQDVQKLEAQLQMAQELQAAQAVLVQDEEEWHRHQLTQAVAAQEKTVAAVIQGSTNFRWHHRQEEEDAPAAAQKAEQHMLRLEVQLLEAQIQVARAAVARVGGDSPRQGPGGTTSPRTEKEEREEQKQQEEGASDSRSAERCTQEGQSPSGKVSPRRRSRSSPKRMNRSPRKQSGGSTSPRTEKEEREEQKQQEVDFKDDSDAAAQKVEKEAAAAVALKLKEEEEAVAAAQQAAAEQAATETAEKEAAAAVALKLKEEEEAVAAAQQAAAEQAAREKAEEEAAAAVAL